MTCMKIRGSVVTRMPRSATALPALFFYFSQPLKDENKMQLWKIRILPINVMPRRITSLIGCRRIGQHSINNCRFMKLNKWAIHS